MRYSRQLPIPEIGPEGQARLQQSRVTIVGAGGLGTPASLYLAAAGVGRITIIDSDTVSMSNLNRQVLYDPQQLGSSKALLLAERLQRFNPEIEVRGLVLRLTAENAGQYLSRDECDVVIDATDNNQTRLLINSAAVQAGVPLIYGAVHSFYGQIMTILPGKGPCLRCLLPNPDAEAASEGKQQGAEVRQKAEEQHGADKPHDTDGQHGADELERETERQHEEGRGVTPVIGITPGIIGSLEATEAIKILLGAGTSLIGRLLTFNALDMRWDELAVKQDPACPVCSRD